MADIRVQKDSSRPLAHLISVNGVLYLVDSRQVEGRYFETLAARQAPRGKDRWLWEYPVYEKRYKTALEMVGGHHAVVRDFEQVLEEVRERCGL